MLQTASLSSLLADRRGAAIGKKRSGGMQGAVVPLADHRGFHPRKVDGGQLDRLENEVQNRTNDKCDACPLETMRGPMSSLHSRWHKSILRASRGCTASVAESPQKGLEVWYFHAIPGKNVFP